MQIAQRQPLKEMIGRGLAVALPQTGLGDRLYATLHFAYRQGRLPRYARPRAFNDHLFRLRVGPESAEPLRRMVCDKLLVKGYVEEVVGPRYVVPTLDLLTSDEEISRFAPPERPCVIKPTHASGRILLLKSPKHTLDRDLLKAWLRTDYYRASREHSYRGLEKRLIVEEVFSDDGLSAASDYKVFCFGGRPKMIQAISGRFTKMRRGFFTPDWRLLPFHYVYDFANIFDRPAFLEEMLEISQQVSKPFSFIRVDFICARDRIKIGELTNCPEGACGRFFPRSIDEELGGLFRRDDVDILRLLSNGTDKQVPLQ